MPSMTTAARSALVVAPSWVGDMVLAQPMLRLLRERLPGLAIDLLAPPWTAGLAARIPEVRTVIESPFGHGELALGRRRAIARDIATRGYDLALVLPNSFKSALVPWLAGIPRRVGFVGEWRQWILTDARRLDTTALPRMVQRFAALALDPGEPLPASLPQAFLRVDPAARAATVARLGLALERPVAALCPGAEYGPAKRWPPSYFATLASSLIERGFQVWLFGSGKDRDVCAEIAAMARAPARWLPVDLAGDTSLAEAIDLMSLARVVISNDSGLMHVAAALERPLIALYGSSSPAFTPPMSSLAHVVQLGLDCSPCFERECPLGHFNCMRQLTPTRILETIDHALS